MDAGRYDFWLNGALLCSYNITIDAFRCTSPKKSYDYQKIYSDWCHEFEKYKLAMKSWERKHEVFLLHSNKTEKQLLHIQLFFCIIFKSTKVNLNWNYYNYYFVFKQCVSRMNDSHQNSLSNEIQTLKTPFIG